jgi:tRNA A-37 threonylcarbamoyl transferase component Bud32
VDKRYEPYCLGSPFFYDLPPGQDFAIADRPLPADWRRDRQGDWMVCVPPEPGTPLQGWKIHASACLDNSEDIIKRVWEYCVPRDISFKFVSSRLGVLVRNGKYASRGASGKIVTIYPKDDAACERILAELDAKLSGAPGPYILSDLRYGAGPLYARYGGFTERRCLDDTGDLVPAIETDTGELVPDVRGPVFATPAWVALPSFLAPHLAVRNAATVDGLPYRVEDVLHFSNGGGVYLGVDEHTGERAVLKEARPHAGLAADGSDAVARLRREHDMLRRLSGLGIAPGPRGYYEAGGHHFLAEEFIEGTPLNSCYAERYPLTTADPDPDQVAAYTEWALRICADISRAAAVMHERGVVFNDLHMFNIMVRPDDTVTFIDFEAASLVADGRLMTVGNPGFVAPRDRTGFGVDAYSLGCIRLALFLPLTTLLTLDRAKAADLAEIIAGHFQLPAGFLAEAVQEITGEAADVGRPGPGTSPGTRTSTSTSGACDEQNICQAIMASATPERADRLFPGDIEQFMAPGGGLGIAHGAAGVLYALSESAGLRDGEHEQWLITRAVDPVKGSRLGLYDGLAGAAWLLARFGHLDAAVKTAGICAGSHWERLGPDLYGGLAGFALAMLAVGDAAAEPGLTDAGLRAAEMTADRQAARAGLLRGAAGQALLFIRLYERTGDPAYLDLARRAVAADLDRCVTDHKGSLQVDEGWRVLPYLNAGSAGIGMVIDRYLTHRPDDAFAAASTAIRIAARSTFYAQSGLFNGRAGMVLYLAAAGDTAGAAAQARRLAWHAISAKHLGGVAFPGDQLLRLSMDLGTGSAGVLLALAASRGVPGAVLPFLDLPGRPAQGSVTERAMVRR